MIEAWASHNAFLGDSLGTGLRCFRRCPVPHQQAGLCGATQDTESHRSSGGKVQDVHTVHTNRLPA